MTIGRPARHLRAASGVKRRSMHRVSCSRGACHSGGGAAATVPLPLSAVLLLQGPSRQCQLISPSFTRVAKSRAAHAGMNLSASGMPGISRSSAAVIGFCRCVAVAAATNNSASSKPAGSQSCQELECPSLPLSAMAPCWFKRRSDKARFSEDPGARQLLQECEINCWEQRAAENTQRASCRLAGPGRAR